MSKRTFEDSQIGTEESHHEVEPQVKRPKSALPNVKDESLSAKEENVDNDSPNGQNSGTSNSAHPLQAETAIDKTNSLDTVIDHFGESPSPYFDASKKLNTGDIEADRDENADDLEPIKTEPEQLPQMLLNPKARMKTENENPPIPPSDSTFRSDSESSQASSPKSVESSASEKAPDVKKEGTEEEAKHESDSLQPVALSHRVEPECCIVEKLIKRYGNATPLSQKEVWMYVSRGRPMPAIPSLGVTENLYEHHLWITGCPKLRSLYCWQCLVFSVKKQKKSHNTVWVKEGFRKMHMLGTSMTKHALSSGHQAARDHKDQLIIMGWIPSSSPRGNRVTQTGNDWNAGDSKFAISESTEFQKQIDTTKPKFPVPSPPVKPATSSNDLKGESSANPRATDIQETEEAFRQKTTTGKTCIVRQSDNSNPGVKPPRYHKLMEDLKGMESKLEPQAKNPPQPPPNPSPVQTVNPQQRFRIDISNLQAKFFSNGTFSGSEELRKQIIAIGRPTPRLPDFDVNVVSTGTYGVPVPFSKSYYEDFPWLCGSVDKNRLFCWPCLVFRDGTDDNIWNTAGIKTLTNLSAAAKEHSLDMGHLKRWVRLKFSEDPIKKTTPLPKKNTTKHNDNAKQKRQILKHLIDAVCLKKKLINNVDFSHEDYNDFLTILSTYDVKLKELLDPKSENYMEDFTPNVAQRYSSEIIKTLSMIVKKEIAGEVERSAYVSFILKAVKHTHVALIVRYCKQNGEVHDRFYKFIRIGFGQREALLNTIFSEAHELKCAKKFVGISYDGGVMRPDQMERFNTSLRSKLPAAYFFYTREDNFKNLLQQSLSNSPYCRSFFHLVTEFGQFLQENPRVERSISRVENIKPTNENKTPWDLKSGIINTILEHYSAIMKFLNQVLNGSLAPHSWSNHVIAQCKKFALFLGLVETRMFLVFFNKVYLALHPLIEAFQGEFHAKYWKTATGASYSLIRDYEFGDIYRAALSLAGESDGEPSCSSADRFKSWTMFNETKEWILKFMKFRTKYIDVWAYFDLSTKNIDSPIARAQKNPTQFLLDLKECFPFFDSQKLGLAMNFIQTEPRFRDKSATEIIDLMMDLDFTAILPELHSFFQLIRAVPLTSAHVTDPVCERLNSYVEGKTSLTTTDTLLHLEKDLLESARNAENFYNDVMDIIAYNCDRSLLLSQEGD